MTRAEYLALKPGDIIRLKYGRKTLRLIVSHPGKTKSSNLGPIGLVKIGYSWTDPNPSAWYDANVIYRNYMVTGKKGCSEQAAQKIRNWRPNKVQSERFKLRFNRAIRNA